MSKLFRKKSVEKIMAEANAGQGDHETALHKNLGVRDLTALGIAAIIGAGIFSTIGTASANGGPAVILLFLFTAVACGFAAFAYAEFASMVPVSGSAYTYSYVAFGELVAWIIGWALIMEYAIGNITVAISWSEYFCRLLEHTAYEVPQWLRMDIVSAYDNYDKAQALLHAGKSFADLDMGLQHAVTAYNSAPSLGGLKLIFNLPAIGILILMTWLVYRGIQESKNAGNVMVLVKLAVILLVIIVGAQYVNVDNWSNFAPNGINGILKGVSSVFFAYIGFDAISTTAEECKNPQRDLPRGMMYSILICTVVYVIIALVLTGIVSYEKLAVGDPLAFVFDYIHVDWMAKIVAVSAVIATASVILVFQLGQPRIWMAMSRDGLLPKAFSKIHPRFKTPSFATIITGVVVVIPCLFMNLTFVTDLCSIGTLFAFVLVCAGVLKLNATPGAPQGSFKTPFINSRYVMPLLVAIGLGVAFGYFPDQTKHFITNAPQLNAVPDILTSAQPSEITAAKAFISSKDSAAFMQANGDLETYFASIPEDKLPASLLASGFTQAAIYTSGWDLFRHKIPHWTFLLVVLGLTILSISKQFSLIPLLGLTCCLYMMAELGLKNWIGFGIWLVLGLLIYFGYSYKNSKLAG